MERSQILNYLGKETVRLLTEFRAEACMLGENPIDRIVFIPETNTIKIIEITGEALYYSLSEIEYIFKDNNKGFDICGINFEEGIKLAKSEAAFEYGQTSRNLFISYIGSIIYSQYRCEEIYNRIIEIQRDVNTL